MYDMHYDLLTILYFNLKRNNKFANRERLIEDCKKIYFNNINGGIVNVYFMSPKEMVGEIDISADEFCDVKGMFKKSVDLLYLFKKSGKIPEDVDVIFGI